MNDDSMSSMYMSMPMTFQATIKTELWITGWKIENGGQYFGTLCVLFVLCLVLEFVSYKRHDYVRQFCDYKRQNMIQIENVNDLEKQLAQRQTQRIEATAKENEEFLQLQKSLGLSQQWTFIGILTCLYALNVSISFLLMLAVMSYNVGFFVTIVFGMSLGHLISTAYHNFEEQKPRQGVGIEMSADLCCAAPIYGD
eukprot:TRINITY_DN50389_c0_g1_i1.p2 TRINITY_DN50389_c0_g1~~TRINITY_DN50389_c0_g1_i1.p2  ORF type:complete len:227 (-),score=17.50 TRINITY_DN50389_c0_g1_i1:303-893(-)